MSGKLIIAYSHFPSTFVEAIHLALKEHQDLPLFV